jgi:hypothetical protein
MAYDISLDMHVETLSQRANGVSNILDSITSILVAFEFVHQFVPSVAAVAFISDEQ